MILRCATCATPFRFDDVNIATGLARCRPCDAVMTVLSGQAPRREIARPARFTVMDTGKGVRIAWPLATRFGRLSLAGILSFYAAATLVFAGGTLACDDWLLPGRAVVAALLGFLGMVLVYMVVGTLLNDRCVQVDREHLWVDQAPL